MRYIFIGVLLILFLGGFYVGLLLGKNPVPEAPASLAEDTNTTQSTMQITSEAFNHNERVPSRFTCDGENINPQLSFSDIPKNTQSLVLIMDDPDIPESVKADKGIEVFDHWIVFDMPAETTTIEENTTPPGTEGQNSLGKSEYTGPCPPDGEHRYFFKLYALDTTVSLSPEARKEDLEETMAGHILEKAELVGLYTRQ